MCLTNGPASGTGLHVRSLLSPSLTCSSKTHCMQQFGVLSTAFYACICAEMRESRWIGRLHLGARLVYQRRSWRLVWGTAPVVGSSWQPRLPTMREPANSPPGCCSTDKTLCNILWSIATLHILPCLRLPAVDAERYINQQHPAHATGFCRVVSQA